MSLFDRGFPSIKTGLNCFVWRVCMCFFVVSSVKTGRYNRSFGPSAFGLITTPKQFRGGDKPKGNLEKEDLKDRIEALNKRMPDER